MDCGVTAVWLAARQLDFTPISVRAADLTHHRATVVQERARVINRLQKVLEDANKLAAVATNVVGISARAMLQALLAVAMNPMRLVDLVRGKLQDKHSQLEQVLRGIVRPYHQFLLTELLSRLDGLDVAIERVREAIATRLQDDMASLILLDSIPGVSWCMARRRSFWPRLARNSSASPRVTPGFMGWGVSR